MAKFDNQNPQNPKPKQRLQPKPKAKPKKIELAGFSGTVRQDIFGCTPDLPDPRDAGFANTITDLPDHMQLDSPMEVRNQGSLQACTSFAVAAAVRFAQIKQGLEDFEPSPLYVFFNTRSIEGHQSLNVAVAPRDAIKAVASDGSCKEEDFPYDESKFSVPPPQNCFLFGRDNKVVTYLRVPPDLTSLKSCIAQGFPFILAFTAFSGFRNIGSDGMIPPASGAPIGGHCMLVLGYDDADQIFMCQNSFGEDFGNQGFVFMSYAYLLQNQFDIWTITQVQEA
ncbi:C1 family peptidase [Zavarzinella formosa]|uniref:C1 family peptidase n=1 Tax=Zavarzinella formosa TaxID=360055 RepID=UPI0003152AB9|nr:C1 family peptidase [Zavarzinella formosa]